MGSMGILIAITCIANYISGMILAREKYDTLKMIVYIVVQVLLSYLLIDKVPRIIVYTGIIGTVYLLYDKSKSFDYSLVIALFVQIIIMIADVIESNLAILITKKDINTLLYRNDYNMIIYAFIAILILSLLSAFVSWVVNKKMKMKMLDFKEINSKLLIVILLINFIIIFSSGNVCKKLGFNNEFIQSLGLLLCLYTLFLAMFMIMFIKNVVSEYDIKLEREKNKQLNLYTKEIEELYNSLRTFKHDYKNILTSMSLYISEKDMDGLAEYFKKNKNILTSMSLYISEKDMDGLAEYFKKTVLPTDLIINNNEFSIASLQYVEVKELKALLAMKQIEAKNKNVDCNIRVLGIVKEINMGIIDLIRIVGILFDNAIQAAEATESGKVTCTLKQGDIFKIEIRNNYIGNIDDTSKFFEKGYTTKESGSGIGLYNFLNIIHNYDNAIYSVTLDNNEFIIRITIS